MASLKWKNITNNVTDWGFNFVSYAENRLTELQFRNDKLHSPKRTYRRSRPGLQNTLGRPNLVDLGLLGQQTWQVDNIWIDNHFAKGSRLASLQQVPVHFLSIRHAERKTKKSGDPRG